jgi:flagellar biosynthesis component FlhA
MEDDQEASERERGKETWWSQGFVLRAPVYLFLLLGCKRVTHVGCFLSLALSLFTLSQTDCRQQQAKKKKKKQKMQKKRKKKQKRETQEEKYGRNLSSVVVLG